MHFLVTVKPKGLHAVSALPQPQAEWLVANHVGVEELVQGSHPKVCNTRIEPADINLPIRTGQPADAGHRQWKAVPHHRRQVRGRGEAGAGGQYLEVGVTPNQTKVVWQVEATTRSAGNDPSCLLNVDELQVGSAAGQPIPD